MEKDHKFKAESYLPEKDLKEFLKKSFPSVFSEGKVSCEKLKQVLGEDYQLASEQYGLTWAGKSGCYREIQETITATLKPNKKESVDFENTGNLFIEGDNLEAMKVLQRSYYGKVKCIYIDPPYNTGGDFIYKDSFKMDLSSYSEASGTADVDGNTTRADGLSVNRKDSNGRFHSDWLNMMYPRLFLARSLLRQDGVIFVSIDDNEVHNLRMIMDEIFGEENFVGQFVWYKKLTGGYDNQYLNTQHDYIFIYTKRKSDFAITLEEKESKYKLTDSKGRKFKWDSLWNVGGLQYSKSLDYPIKAPDGSDIWPIGKKGVAFWLWSKDKVDKNRDELKFKKDRNGNWRVYKKVYASEGIVPGSILDKNKVKGNTYSSREMKNIFGWKIFDYAKPTPLLKYLITRGTNLSSNDIVLDFFAGAGTTAQAVMEQNAEDGGNRKWICIQLPELCEEDSEAFKAGYKNIAEIAKERIRRAGKKIEKENKEKVDTGFKSFKLDKSNFKIWKGKIKNKEDLIGQMEMFIDNVKENSTEENILHELILKSGLELDVDIKEKEFKTPASAKASAGKEKYYSLAEGRLLVYLGDNISIEMGEYLQSQKPEKIICMERAFQNDDNLKTNILLQAEQEGIDFKVI